MDMTYDQIIIYYRQYAELAFKNYKPVAKGSIKPDANIQLTAYMEKFLDNAKALNIYLVEESNKLVKEAQSTINPDKLKNHLNKIAQETLQLFFTTYKP
ncbi:MAG: hypothetical protein ACJ748_11580 [Flavisolibacter sp.]